MKRLAIFPLLLIAISPMSGAQLCQKLTDDLKEYRGTTSAEKRKQIIDGMLDPGEQPFCYLQVAYLSQATGERDRFKDLIQRFEQVRADKQTGASVGSSGTTSLVSRGVAAKTLSLAAEYGALTQAVSGQVVTFRGNLAGVPTAAIDNGLVPYCDPRLLPKNQEKGCIGSGLLTALRRFSFGVSFDASRDDQSITATAAGSAPADPTTATPVTFTGRRREISMVQGRVELWTRHDNTSGDYQKAWLKAVQSDTQASARARQLTTALEDFFERLDASEELKKWQDQTRALLQNAPSDHLEQTLLGQLLAWGAIVIQTKVATPEDLVKISGMYASTNFSNDQIIEVTARKPVVTLEYTNQRPLAQTDTHNFRVIGEFTPWAKTSLTVNAAFTLYDAVPADAAKAGVGRWRDRQAAVQLERSFGKLALLGPAAATLSGYYQWQVNPALLSVDPTAPLPGITFAGLPASAKTVFAQKGNLWVTQARLTMGTGTSIKVPLAISYSNRTELINKPAWKAQIGISYDFDALFSR